MIKPNSRAFNDILSVSSINMGDKSPMSIKDSTIIFDETISKNQRKCLKGLHKVASTTRKLSTQTINNNAFINRIENGNNNEFVHYNRGNGFEDAIG
jgi:hypothetical protein